MVKDSSVVVQLLDGQFFDLHVDEDFAVGVHRRSLRLLLARQLAHIRGGLRALVLSLCRAEQIALPDGDGGVLASCLAAAGGAQPRESRSRVATALAVGRIRVLGRFIRRETLRLREASALGGNRGLDRVRASMPSRSLFAGATLGRVGANGLLLRR